MIVRVLLGRQEGELRRNVRAHVSAVHKYWSCMCHTAVGLHRSFILVLIALCLHCLHTFPMSAGMFMELVAKPIPNIMAAGFPTNLAT